MNAILATQMPSNHGIGSVSIHFKAGYYFTGIDDFSRERYAIEGQHNAIICHIL
jgi:hypothetical protein